MEQLFQAFNEQRYQDAVAAAGALDPGAIEVQRYVGISLLRLGRLDDAESWLLRAYAQRDPEGTVEYANLLRATGRLQEAIQIFAGALPELSGELYLRCLRWLGVSEFIIGKWTDGLAKCEQAWLGYLSYSDETVALKVSQNLANMYRITGNYKKAENYLKKCLKSKSVDPTFRLNVIKTIVDVYIETGDLKQAMNYVDLAQEYTGDADKGIVMHFLASKLTLNELLGEEKNYRQHLEEIHGYALENDQYDLLVWSSNRIIDQLSRQGDFSQALRVVYNISARMNPVPIEIALAKALIHRRQGDLRTSIEELEQIRATLAGLDPNKNSITALLHLGYAYYIEKDFEQSLSVLKEGLEGLLRLNSHTAFKPVLEEMSELLHYASLEPSLEPYLEPVMESMADLLGGGPREDGATIQLQVYTLGQVSVAKDGLPITFSLRGSVPLLVYLAQRPNRTRAELQLDLYPDKEPDAAGAYVRQAIRELREVLGRDVVVSEGPHNQPRYRLGDTVQLDLDLARFMDAVEQGEVARALALYRGEFLPGMDESEWVRARREESRLALGFELRNQIARYREEREWRRMVLLANQYLRVDPYDLEVHELRIEGARRAGSASELARYIAQMKSLDN